MKVRAFTGVSLADFDVGFGQPVVDLLIHGRPVCAVQTASGKRLGHLKSLGGFQCAGLSRNKMRSSKTPGSARRVRVPSKLRTTTITEVGIVLRTEIGMRFPLNAGPFQQSLIVCRPLSSGSWDHGLAVATQCRMLRGKGI